MTVAKPYATRCLKTQWLFVVFLVAFNTAFTSKAIAQGPLRERPVRIPRTDVVLEEGWMLVFTDRAASRCMYAVPSKWVVSPQGWWATEPHGAVRVDLLTFGAAQWAAHRAAIQAALPSAVVREDTPHRMQIDGSEGPWTWEHVAEGDGAHVCAATIETRSIDRIQQVVQKIASTVHVAHESDLSWIKKR